MPLDTAVAGGIRSFLFCCTVSGTVHRGKVHENTTKQKLSGTAVLLTMGLFSTSTVRVRPYSLEVRPQRTAMSNQAVHTWRVCCETQMSNALWCCQLCSDNRNCIGVMWRGVLDTHVTTEPSHSTTGNVYSTTSCTVSACLPPNHSRLRQTWFR